MPKSTPKRRPTAAAHRRVRVFAALGDETRLALVEALSAGEAMPISRLAEGRNQSRQSITKHLRVLAEAGVVRGVRRGRQRCFELKRETLDDARESLDRLSRQWDIALNRLKHMLESEQAERESDSA